MSDEKEIPLEGGNTNAPVKIGQTVRKNVLPNSGSVHQFLLYLRKSGFHKAPEFLGLDEKGREILSFVEGSPKFPERMWLDDDALVQAAKMLREFHNISRNFDKDGLSWAFSYPDTARHEVICHNDFAPYNMIFDETAPIGIVDFDLCGPGPAIRDFAYMAYWLTPLSFAKDRKLKASLRDKKDGSRRLILLCDTYGLEDRTGLLPMISEVLHHMGSLDVATAMVGKEVAAKLDREGHLSHWRREATAFDAERDGLEKHIL